MRIPKQRYAEEIDYAWSFLPHEIEWITNPEHGLLHIFLGDPVFAGLGDPDTLKSEHSPTEVPHAMYPWHIRTGDPVCTIVMARPDEWILYDSLWHELGHILHYILGFEDFDIPCVTDYARTDHCEKFAEAFVAWLHLDRWGEKYCGTKNLTRDDVRFLDAVILG